LHMRIAHAAGFKPVLLFSHGFRRDLVVCRDAVDCSVLCAMHKNRNMHSYGYTVQQVVKSDSRMSYSYAS
jgi:hypothetical protein